METGGEGGDNFPPKKAQPDTTTTAPSDLPAKRQLDFGGALAAVLPEHPQKTTAAAAQPPVQPPQPKPKPQQQLLSVPPMMQSQSPLPSVRPV